MRLSQHRGWSLAGSWPGAQREAGERPTLRAMPDDPTPRGGNSAEQGSTAADLSGDVRGPTWRPGEEACDPRTVPGGDYRWHGPSPHSYPGAEAFVPYGPGWRPYGPYQQAPYQQGPYQQGPYQQGPYQQGPYQQAPYQQAPYQQGPYAWTYVPPAPPRAPRSAEERRRRRRQGLMWGGALVILLGAGIGIGAALAPTSPATVATNLVNRAISAAVQAGTFRYVEHSTQLGAPDDIAGNAAPNGGSQVILQRCSGGTTYFHLRLVKGVVYFKGTRTAVVDQLGVPLASASSAADKWIKVVKTDKIYTTLADGITTRSNISQLRRAIVPLSTKHVPGSSSIEVLGAFSKTPKRNQLIGNAALFVNSSTGRPTVLRGRASTTTGAHTTLTWTFSRYGKPVHVVAPPTAVAYSSLHAKTPAKNICA
jgi:hypothetical protein